MPLLGSQHGLHPGPEHPAHLADVGLGHGGPLPLHGGLEGLEAWVREGTGLGLHLAGDALAQGGHVWGGGGG